MPTTTPISKLTRGQLVALAASGHLSLVNGKITRTEKASRAGARSATRERREAVLSDVTDFFGTVRGQASRFWSVKPTSGNSASAPGIISFVSASREDILWSLKRLETDGLARQIGVLRGQIVEASAVNNFQRRWVHSVPAVEDEISDDQ